MKNNQFKSPQLMTNIKNMDKNLKPFLGISQSTDTLRIKPKTPSLTPSHHLEIGVISPINNKEKVISTSNSNNNKQIKDGMIINHEPSREQSRDKFFLERYKRSLSNITSNSPEPNSIMLSTRNKSTANALPTQSTLINREDGPLLSNTNIVGLDFQSPKASTKLIKHDELNSFQMFMSRMTKLSQKNQLPNYEPTKYSDKCHGIIRGFAVCTNQGLIRDYNEDRVAIVLNIIKPATKPHTDYWPNCSFFGIYDGHGGNKCAEFLRGNLHQYVIRSKYFPWNVQKALKEAFDEADRIFLDLAQKDTENGTHDRSGSCALVLLIIDDMCYVANVGDSRAIVSQRFGASKYPLTRDHKPSDELEQKRINEAGGKIYQNFPIGSDGKRLDLDFRHNPFQISIPFRVFPGRLSVSRAVGDIEAKLAKFGGNQNVLISKPEITTMQITKDNDFIFMGCDGIFDKLSNEEIINHVWECLHDSEATNFHDFNRLAVERILKESLLKKSLDNVTGILISFSNLENRYLEEHERPNSKADHKIFQNKSEGALNRITPKIDHYKSDEYGFSLDLKAINSPSRMTPIYQRNIGGINLNSDDKRRELSKNDIRGIDQLKYSNYNVQQQQQQQSLPRLGIKSPR